MNFERNSPYSCRFEYQTFYPECLSSKLIMVAESKVVSPSIERAEKLNSPLEIFFIWVSVIYIIGWISYQIIQGWGTKKIETISISSCSQAPCKNCKFYHRDPHLKCAVHPSLVMTDLARDCIDYCEEQSE